MSFKTGIARVSIPFLGWGTSFLDYDNDGWLDLLVVNGHVYPKVDALPWNTTYAQRALLLRNLSGRTFEDVGAAAGALAVPHVSRGAAVGDFDDDGGVDVVVNNLDGAPLLAVNDGRRGRWLTLALARRSGAEVSPGCDRIDRVRERRRTSRARRSSERTQPDVPIRLARAHRAG